MSFNVARVCFSGQPSCKSKQQEDWEIARQAVQVLGSSGLKAMGLPDSTTLLVRDHSEKLPGLKTQIGEISQRAASMSGFIA